MEGNQIFPTEGQNTGGEDSVAPLRRPQTQGSKAATPSPAGRVGVRPSRMGSKEKSWLGVGGGVADWNLLGTDFIVAPGAP